METSFLYANVLECGVENKKEVRRCADYFGFFEGDGLKGILPFYNLGSCIPHYETEAAIEPFVEIMKDRPFEYLLGMEQVVGPIFRKLKEFRKVVEYNESDYFINRSYKPFRMDGMKFVDPEEDKSERVIDFIVTVRNEGFHENVSRESVENMLKQQPSEGKALIAAIGGKLVAYASIQTYTDSINQIGSVYTAVEERGKGYCKAVVSELCDTIIAGGKTPTLFVKKNNTPAVRAYTALGFEHFDDYLLIRME